MLQLRCDVVMAGARPTGAERALVKSETRSVTAPAVELVGRFDVGIGPRIPPGFNKGADDLSCGGRGGQVGMLLLEDSASGARKTRDGACYSIKKPPLPPCRLQQLAATWEPAVTANTRRSWLLACHPASQAESAENEGYILRLSQRFGRTPRAAKETPSA